ncbi:uncharacterized protein E0L32_007157 [Thyridium curvatum]|uniref:Uncharacterized protein n=1 Tax=Thyridium curvatum TaxID=1093900 RepID=A0A507AQ02_9PEZI|nr:uncharacterized protein E0L32_007157 [Thyridium curvatum]TPX12042.1 hypothetical protein E0L32_007157 [Thyridium curvatum]
MLASPQSLQTPKTGRSRFSKALPAPPPELANNTAPVRTIPESTMETTADMFPSVPAPPPKQEDAAARPLNSPLPPLPMLKRKANPPPPMSIPRRPVGNTVPPAEKSPAASISSLLSAYSRTSEESVVKSSEGTASTKTSYIATSPSQETSLSYLKRDSIFTPLSLLSFDDEPQRPAAQAQRSPVDERDSPAPPPPLKDPKRPSPPQQQQQQPLSKTTAPAAESAQASSPTTSSTPTNSSPSQLLRRRSLKSEKSLALPDLRLQVSHGSTAQSQLPDAPPSISPLFPPQPAFAREEAASPRIPRSAPLGLPGRNIRPAVSQEQLAQPAPRMGEVVSKVETKVESRLAKKDARSPMTEPKPEEAQQRSQTPKSPIKRLPTPEYEQHDVQKPLVETIVSPESPASSPELPSQEKDAAKAPISRKAIGVGLPSNVRPMKSIPQFPTPPSKAPERRLNEPRQSPQPSPLPKSPVPPEKDQTQVRLTPQPSPLPRGSPLPKSPAPNRATPQSETAQFPARTTSRGVEQPAPAVLRREPASQVSPVSDKAPAAAEPTRSSSQEKKSLETIRAPRPQLSLDISEPNLGFDAKEASPAVDIPAFPLAFSNPEPPGTVFPAKPVGQKHFQCYQGHRSMGADRNFNYPLACQVCLKQDTEVRFKCRWCYLRICQSCMEIFQENGRDLKYLIDHCHDAKTPKETTSFGDVLPPVPVAQGAD